jgi:plastocyanin
MDSKNLLYVVISLVGIVAIFSLAFIFGPSSTDQSGSDATETPSSTIIIAHDTLTWTNSTIKAGNNITWINKDFAINHQIVSDSSNFQFDSGVLKNGQSYSLNFTKTGTYNYHDKLNPNLKGIIIVQQ